MRIWLGRGVLPSGRKHMNVGVHIYEDENIEVKKVIKIIQDSLARNFPNAEVIKSKAVRELFGERN